MTKKILILGTLHGQAEAMEACKSIGWTVYSCGFKREGPGVDAADEFFLVDILDIDGVTALAKRLEVDCVYCVGSDIAMPTVAAVSEKLNLPLFHSSELTDILHRKVRLRAFLEAHGLSRVKYATLKETLDLERFSDFPAIVKPADSQGQRGITRVNCRAEAEAALPLALKASSTGTAIIEEWLEGREVSVHVFVVEGQIRFFLPSDRFTWQGESIGLPRAHGLPSRWLDDHTVVVIRQLVEDFVEGLNILNGPLYFQLILTSSGPKIVEVAPRLDGCHLWRLIDERTGFNLLLATFRYLVDGIWEEPVMKEDCTTHVLNFFLAEPNSAFHSADFPPLTTGRICYLEYQLAEGDMIRDGGSPVTRVGYFVEEVS
ncbi:ATP-grasp domain-containing protein [Accumulibacter sp.]|uniref:ATP-grasp domain-containing protein n=1 Tax=Accumulibacter sp. TaxID=2053492 RepID=UPI0026229CA8|nr:ATP-grasp domain-containing protein [Accumulibacter sp.]